MKRLKIAQIGIGHDHAGDILISLHRHPERFELVGFALAEGEEGRFFHTLSRFEGIPERTVEEILNDPTIEAVAIETEEVNLTRYALLAAQYGKHIHMDKPGGLDPVMFDTLVETVRKRKLVFHLGYMYRYNPAVKNLLEQVRNGELGEIFSVEAHMDCRHTPEKRQWLGSLPGGMMFFLGCHLVDLLLQIRGMPQKIIPYNRCTGADGVSSEDYAMVVFDYPNGISFAKACAEEVDGFSRRQLVVTGTKGTIVLQPLEMCEPGSDYHAMFTGFHTAYMHKRPDPKAPNRSEYFDRYDAMMSSFARMALGEIENPYSYDYELLLYKTILRCCGVEYAPNALPQK